jgi:hypothetical protein
MKKILHIKAAVLALIGGILLLLGLIAGLAHCKIVYSWPTYLWISMAVVQYGILITLLHFSLRDKSKE